MIGDRDLRHERVKLKEVIGTFGFNTMRLLTAIITHGNLGFTCIKATTKTLDQCDECFRR